MLRMRQAALAATALCGLLAAGAARADVIYTFTGAPSTQNSYFAPTLQVDVTDAAVASGSLNVSGQESPRNALSGDTSGFVRVSSAFFGSGISVNARNNGDGTYAGMDSFSIAMIFGSGDALQSANVSLVNRFDPDSLTVVGSTAGGGGYQLTYNSDSGPTQGCGSGTIPTAIAPYCSGSGTWTATSTDPTPAPEPASLALLGAGLIGLGAVRKRQLKL